MLVKEIAEEDVTKIVSEFSHKDGKSVLLVEETDIAKLAANEKIFLVQTESLEDSSPELAGWSFDSWFKCCLITMPDSFTLDMYERVMNMFPTENTVIGVRKGEKLKIIFLLNAA